MSWPDLLQKKENDVKAQIRDAKKINYIFLS